MSSPNSLARREAKRSKWAPRPGLSAGLGGGGAPNLPNPTEDSSSFPFPSSQAILRGKSILVVCEDTASKQELCGALYRDEKHPEASRFCSKPLGCRIAGHKSGEKAYVTAGIYVHEINTKRKNTCFHKPRGSISLMDNHLTSLLAADTSSLTLPSRRAFWAKAFEALRGIESSAAGTECLNKIFADFKEPLSDVIQDSSDEEDTEFTETASLGSAPITITNIDLDQGRPVDELPFSLQEATKLCEIEPVSTAAQEASLLSILVKAADTAGEVLPVPFQFPHFGMRGYEATKKLCETSKTLFDRATQFSFQLEEFNSSIQQVKDKYDRRVSKPADVLFKEANLWNAVQNVKTTVILNEGKTKKINADIVVLKENQTSFNTQDKQLKELTAKVAAAEAKTAQLEKELAAKRVENEEMYLGFNSVQDTFISQMKRLDERINNISVPSPNSDGNDLTSKISINRLDDFENSLSVLNSSLNAMKDSHQQQGTSEQQTVHVQGTEGITFESFRELSDIVASQGSRITSIEAFNKEGVVERSVHVGDKLYHTHDDLRVDIQTLGTPIEIGFVTDIIMVLEDCHGSVSNKLDQLDDMKLQTLSNSLGMSVATSTAIHCGALKFPSIFCGKSKIGVSAFGAVKFENWRGKGIIRSGIAHQIETALPNIRAKYLSAINMHYKRSIPEENQWRLISEDCLKTSCTFILDLVNYIDEMMRTLTQGAGNDENEAWAVVMAAVGKLFEEYFSPVRGLPISDIPKADTDSVSARRFFAKALWSNLQMFELTKELTNSNSGIKNHPIISSAYTEWGLLNSGKPMAAKAIKAAEKTTEEVKEISNTLSKLQKLVNEVQQTAKNAKNVADRLSNRLDKAGGAQK